MQIFFFSLKDMLKSYFHSHDLNKLKCLISHQANETIKKTWAQSKAKNPEILVSHFPKILVQIYFYSSKIGNLCMTPQNLRVSLTLSEIKANFKGVIK